VNRLSNLSSRVDGKDNLVCRAVPPSHIRLALSFVLGDKHYRADDSRVDEFIEVAGQRGILLSRMYAAELAGKMIWSLLPVQNPGRTILILGTPHASADLSEPARQTLLLCCDEFGKAGIHVAQALLEPGDAALANLYTSAGFVRIAELYYMQRTIRRAKEVPTLPDAFRILTYSLANHALFAQAILNSYEQSMDCPMLSGMREIDDIMAGHQSVGIFDPLDWMVVLQRDVPVAVLLLNQTIHGEGLELVYLGVCPEARGQGLGEYLMRVTERRVVEKNAGALSLTVDSKNIPAVKLYHRHGLERAATKIAMIKNLRGPNPEIR